MNNNKGEKIVFNVPKNKNYIFNNFIGLGPFIQDACVKYKSKIVQVDSETGHSETFENLNRRSIQCALELTALGVKSHDVITICSRNIMDAAVATVAAIYLGAVPSFLDPNLDEITTTHLLKQVNPKIIFSGPESVKLIETGAKVLETKRKIIVFGAAELPMMSFDDLFKIWKDSSNFKPFVPNTNKDTAMILFSSGTSGLAKGICLSHIGLLEGIQFYGDYFPNLKSCVHLTSFYWISGISFFLYCFVQGIYRVVIPKFDINTALAILEKYKVNAMTTTTIIIEYLKHSNYKQYDLSNLYYLGVGGNPISKEQLEIAMDIFPNSMVMHSYGMTEQCGSVFCFNPQTDKELIMEKLNSVGKPVPGITCKVVNIDTGETLGPNQRGELRFTSSALMNGYYNRDSSGAWDANGWFCTGDVAYFDKDGCFYIVDRIKEVLRFRGWHVPPSKLEALLQQHPLVKEAVVVGIPHEADGDLATGVVVLKETDKVPKGIEEELVQFVADRVGFNDRLHGGLKVVKDIPRTPTGKTKRGDIRFMLQEGRF